MITADASIVANHLNEYVYNLHRYLGPFCFTKGAFVIEDDGTLLTLLNQYSPTYISGKLRSHIGAAFPLSKAAEAHKLLEENTLKATGTLSGKVILLP